MKFSRIFPMTHDESIREIVKTAKIRLLKMHFEANVGHIGGNLSCIDSLVALHHAVFGPDDRFVLSKGHAAGALYVTLWTLGRITEEDLLTFHKDGTRLSGHPPTKGISGIEFATGSLGHGLPLASGLALAKRLRGDAGRVYCLTSDGEWQEGANWEAVIFARRRRLPLTTIIDANGLQGFGDTKSIAGMDDIAGRLRAFDCDVVEIDGHDSGAIINACRRAQNHAPAFIVAHTIKGNGVSFMAGKMEWHYLPMTQVLYDQAISEVNAGCTPK